MSNIIDKIQLSGVTYAIGGGGGGTVSSAITSGDTNAVAGGAVYDKFDEVEQVTAQALNVLNESLSGKQDTLSAGTGIDITSNVISVTGSTGGKAIEAGRGISVTTGETADTISVSLPISAGTGTYSIIENSSNNTATGSYSHAEGYGTTAGANNYAHAEGWYTLAGGIGSHAEGGASLASGQYSHAEGCYTTASTSYAHAEGYYTRTNNISEHASGQYNVSSKASTTFGGSGNTLFSVGNGTSNNARHNAFEIRQNGDIYLSSGGTDIKLQDHLGGGSSYTAGDGINISSNDVISVTGKVSTSVFNTYSAATDSRLAEDEEVTAAALNNLNEALSGKQDTLIAGDNITISGNVISATGGGTVESAITSGSTNAVESKAIWSATTYNKEVTLQWDNGFPSKLSTNYPSGCKKFVVTMPSNNGATIELYNGRYPIGGSITISNSSSLSVSIDGLNGITYTISGNDVTFVVPDTITFDQLQTDTRKITSIKAIVEGAWIADNTYMKSEVDAIQNTLQNNINQKLDSTAYTPVNVDSALIENSTNPVEGGVLYDELVYKGAASETTIEWSGNESTNYPSGCTKIKVEVSGSNNGMSISFYDDNWQRFGGVNINNWGGISVYFNDLQGATYEISGTTVTISYPSVTGVTKINSSGMVTYTTKAVTYGASTTVKDALGGLKFVKLTQTEYDNLQPKDSNTLYVIVN